MCNTKLRALKPGRSGIALPDLDHQGTGVRTHSRAARGQRRPRPSTAPRDLSSQDVLYSLVLLKAPSHMMRIFSLPKPEGAVTEQRALRIRSGVAASSKLGRLFSTAVVCKVLFTRDLQKITYTAFNRISFPETQLVQREIIILWTSQVDEYSWT